MALEVEGDPVVVLEVRIATKMVLEVRNNSGGRVRGKVCCG